MTAGAVFDQDDDGIVVLLDATPSDDLREAVEEAAAVCPADVIHVE
jgi:ferredoxin